MYKDLKAIYDRERLEMFASAITYLLDVGFRNVTQITDEQISKIKDAGWATADFQQAIVRIAREIAVACGNDVVEIIMFCMVHNIFDVTNYGDNPHRIPWDRMSEIATNAIWGLHENGGDWDEDLEYAGLDLEYEEKEFFGIPVEEDDDDSY